MPTAVLPNVEALIIFWLAGGAFAAGGIHAEFPLEPTYPLLVVARIGGVPVDPRWVDAATLQIDAYGDTKQEAHDTAATAIARLLDLNDTAGIIDTGDVSGIVTGVHVNSALPWLPDETREQPRYLATVTVTAHP
jgi:hypothetical protein